MGTLMTLIGRIYADTRLRPNGRGFLRNDKKSVKICQIRVISVPIVISSEKVTH